MTWKQEQKGRKQRNNTDEEERNKQYNRTT